jgi:ABC-type glycerol-3-phosphate transport system substrate-binding protein
MGDLVDAVIGDASYADNKYSEWVDRYQEMLDRGYFNDDIQTLDFYQGEQLVENRQAAMSIFAHAYVDTLENSMGSDTIGFAPMPVFGDGALKSSFTAQTQVYTIPKSSKNKELAAKFILFLHEKDNMKLLYDNTYAFMPNTNFDPSWAKMGVDKKVMEWKAQFPEISYQFYYPPMFESEGLIPLVQSLTAGTETPSSVKTKLDAVLVKWREQNPDQLESFKKWGVE